MLCGKTNESIQANRFAAGIMLLYTCINDLGIESTIIPKLSNKVKKLIVDGIRCWFNIQLLLRRVFHILKFLFSIASIIILNAICNYLFQFIITILVPVSMNIFIDESQRAK